MTNNNEKQVVTTPRKIQEETINMVLERVTTFQESGELVIPKDYSAANALKSAWLILQTVKNRDGKAALDVCTKDSICNALLKMVVLGVSPLKKQCDFIVYGDQLSCDLEYTGNIVLAKRFGGLKFYAPNVVLEGDEFEYEINPETGCRRVVKHEQKLENLADLKVRGAYVVYELEDGYKNVEIMNIKQIQTAWAQGAAKGNSAAHQKFPDQMAIKTVINRMCKLLIRGSNDNRLLEEQDDDNMEALPKAVTSEIKEKANKTTVSMNTTEGPVVLNTKDQQAVPEGTILNEGPSY